MKSVKSDYFAKKWTQSLKEGLRMLPKSKKFVKFPQSSDNFRKQFGKSRVQRNRYQNGQFHHSKLEGKEILNGFFNFYLSRTTCSPHEEELLTKIYLYRMFCPNVKFRSIALYR